jgi:two-component system, cell cycle sensor histidine kinase and response regulator CckA
MSRSGSWLRTAASVGFALLRATVVLSVCSSFSTAQEAESLPKRVLILYSFDNEQGVYPGFDHALRSQLRTRAHSHVEFFSEYLDLLRFPSTAHAQDLVKLLRLKYAEQKPDLIVPVSYPAVQFLEGEGKDLFPGTPIVALFNARRLEPKLGGASGVKRSMTVLATNEQPARSLDLALRLQPDTQHVAVVIGSSPLEKYWLDQYKQDFAPYAKKLDVIYLAGLPMSELVKQVALLPAHTVIVMAILFEDANGQFFLQEEAMDMIVREARAPVYATYSSYLGHGVVGGHMTNTELLGQQLAVLALPVLNGQDAAGIPMVMDNSAQNIVDWRQLRRWGISEKRVPPTTLELYREQTAWERYRTLIIASLALGVVEAILILALVLSVHRRRHAEKQLLREKTLADAVIESLPGVFILKDDTGKHVRWNKNAQMIHRYPLQDDLGLANITDRSKDAVRQAEREAFERGSSEIEADVLLEDGTTAPFYFTGVRVELEGKPHLAAVGIDLTQSKKAEAAVRESEAELRSLVEHAPYGIGTISVRQNRFLHANPALVKMLGYRSEAEVLALVVSRDLYCDGDSRWQPTQADFFSALELIWKRKDGKPVTVRASGRRIPSTHNQGDIIEIIAEDVTARRVLEEQLRHAQKLEALGQLSGSVAHDFNNLISVIIGYSELLTANPKSEGPMREHVETIRKAGERAASLTAQLLAFSRRQAVQPKVVNMNSLIRETQKILQQLAREDVEQRITLAPALGTIKADPGQMVQVIMNLVVNSRDAMPDGGRLTIETANVAFAERTTIGGIVVPADNYVRLSVSDTGMGMDAETQAQIFEPFFTTKEAGKGTGLGLATVYGIVKKSGGYVFAESEIGKGTTFNIYFPQFVRGLEDDSMEVESSSLRHNENGHGSETLLVVEDEPAFRDLLRDGLESRGYEVLLAANGVDAMQVAEQYTGSIRLLITDVIMPQMSGPELARSLRKVRSSTDVLYMSGYTDDKVGDILSSDELTLIQKPFYIDDLVRKIQEILARGTAHASSSGSSISR